MFKTFERFVPHRRPVIVVIHVVLVTLAYMLAFLLRFEFDLSAKKAKVVSGDPSQLLELKNY